MVTYCLGSARQKREYFKDMTDITVLQNVEVLFSASENGRNYFAYGVVPFSAFTVEEYIKYKLSSLPCDGAVAVIKKLDIPLCKRLGSLRPAEMRCVDFAVLMRGDIGGKVVINLDGAKYSRKNAVALNRLLSCVSDSSYVCVTDERFLRRVAVAHTTVRFGKKVGRARPKFYAAKRLSKLLHAYRVAVM